MARFQWSSLLVVASGLGAALAAPVHNETCVTQSAPNPLREQYPTDITGTLNGTVLAWLVDIGTAKDLASPYPLLVGAAKAKYPALPEGQFPLFTDAVLNWDGGQGNQSSGPFIRYRANVPFVDRLEDGYTSFRKNLPIAISRSIIDLSAAFGAPLSDANAATFEPSCNGYGAVKSCKNNQIYQRAYLENQTKPVFVGNFHEGAEPFGLQFFKNITNQPAFGAGLGQNICAQGISFYNYSLTAGPFAPIAIRGSMTLHPPLLKTTTHVENASGYKLDVAFLERQFSNCSALSGYAGTGPGDSG